MNAKRIIPCLDMQNGKVVKGVKFEDIADVGDPVALGKKYSDAGADELVFYDIKASMEGRSIFSGVVLEALSLIKVPLTVGGGLATLGDIENALSWGVSKVSINSGMIKNPSLIYEAARRFGSERIVFSIDIKPVGDKLHVFAKGGRDDTGIDAIEWIKRGDGDGAGEFVINSIETDGVREGFDLATLKTVCDVTKLPVIASGGAGSILDFVTLFKEVPQVDAGLAASVFHFGTVDITELKETLAENSVNVKI